MKTPNMIDAKRRNKDKVNYVNYNVDLQFGEGKTFFVRTYGCQMNEHDSEKIRGMLKTCGFSEADSYEDADVVILNTCAIRENAHDKVFGFLGVLKHIKDTKNKDLIIGLCGCMSQEEVVVDQILNKYKYVDFVCGTHNLDNILNIIKNKIDTNKRQIEVLSYSGDVVEGVPVKRDSKYSAWVDIIYGCDKFCTYCIVPYTRGGQRSRKKEAIIEEVKQLKEEGYLEVTLLGQNVNAYGKDLYDDYDLADLLKDVSEIGIPRVRFVTSHPWDFTERMVDVIAEHENIMPYIHLPLQSGSNKVLKAMNRRYTKEDYLKLYDSIRTKVKNASVTTDIIVGFPGETEEDFQDTLDVVNYCKYDGAFTFAFSKRENTPAALMKETVTEEEKLDRLHRLNEVVNKYSNEANQKLKGQVLKCLVTSLSEKDKSKVCGYTENMKLVNIEGSSDLIGKIVDVEITETKSFSLDGKYVEVE